MLEPPHRKRMRHFNVPGHAHLLTFSCYQRRPLLTNDAWRTALSAQVDLALDKYNARLIAFVYMPEHAHLLVFPTGENYGVDKILYAIKRPFSFRIKQILQQTKSPLLSELTIVERPGKMSFRFWQEGGGHDRNLTSVENCVRAAEYIHGNPVRRGLCRSPDQWRWSSWKFYHRPGTYKDSTLPRVKGLPG